MVRQGLSRVTEKFLAWPRDVKKKIVWNFGKSINRKNEYCSVLIWFIKIKRFYKLRIVCFCFFYWINYIQVWPDNCFSLWNRLLLSNVDTDVHTNYIYNIHLQYLKNLIKNYISSHWRTHIYVLVYMKRMK